MEMDDSTRSDGMEHRLPYEYRYSLHSTCYNTPRLDRSRVVLAPAVETHTRLPQDLGGVDVQPLERQAAAEAVCQSFMDSGISKTDRSS